MSDEKKRAIEKEKEATGKSNQIVPENYGQQAAGTYQQNYGGGMPPYAQGPPFGQQSYGQQMPYGQPGPYGQQMPFNQQPYGQQMSFNQQPPFNQQPQQPPFDQYQQQPFDQKYPPPNFNNQAPPPNFNNQAPPPNFNNQAPYQFGAYDQQQVPQSFDNSGGQGPYGQFPPFDPQAQAQGYPPFDPQAQAQGYPPFDPNGYGQYPPGDFGQFPPGPPPVAPAADAPATKFFQATEEQLLEYRDSLRQKFRATLPFDWLGQADNQWYSSWCMKQENFVAFRLGLALYAYWAWDKFHGQVFGNTWTGDWEFFTDPSSIVRAGVTWLSLLSVFVGVLGVTVFSALQLVLSEKSFNALSSYRLHTTRMGKILNWLVFGMNFHYDAAPITACMALVLTVTPNNFYQIKLAQPLWPALTLPLLVLMDLWLVKRCRIDSTYIRRNMIIMISFVAVIGLTWSYFFYYVFRTIFAIFTTKSFVAEIAPTLVLTLAFVMITVIGTDGIYNFLRFKSYFLIANHFDKIAARDVNKILADNEEKYNLKRETLRLQMEAEHAKYMADLAAQFATGDSAAGVTGLTEVTGVPSTSADITTGVTEPLAEARPEKQ